MNKRKSILHILLTLLVSIFLLAPLLMTIVYSFFRDFTQITPRDFTFVFYQELFSSGQIWPVIFRTILISVLPVFLTLIIMLLAVYGMKMYYPKADIFMDAISKVPYGIQGVIMAVSLIFLYANSGQFYGNRIYLLVCSYSVLICPYMYHGVKNTLSTIDMKPILEAAEVLGASPFIGYWTIIIPSVYRGLLATMLLCSGLLFADFVLVNILAGSYYETLGVFLNRILSVSGPTASAVSTIMSLIMLSLSFLVNHLNKQQKSEATDLEEQ